MRRVSRSVVAALLTVAVVGGGLLARPAESQAPKSGGTLKIMTREDTPQGFAVHESATISTAWPSSPCFNNLVTSIRSRPQESTDTVIGELAEKWSWQDNYRNLVFFLRKGVKWHDGQPFTSKDVKFTFDMVREAPDAAAKLRINPRKDWYANVDHDRGAGPLHRGVPTQAAAALAAPMLASGYTPVYAAHIPPAAVPHDLRRDGALQTEGVGKGEYIDYVKNTDYFVKGRPFLDGSGTSSSRSAAPAWRRCRPARSTSLCPGTPEDRRRADQDGGAAARGHPRGRQR